MVLLLPTLLMWGWVGLERAQLCGAEIILMALFF